MAFVSQCTRCQTLTMMSQCPKCGGATSAYHSTGFNGLNSSSARTPPPSSKHVSPAMTSTRGKVFPQAAAPGSSSSSTPVATDVARLQAELRRKDEELQQMKQEMMHASQEHHSRQLSPSIEHQSLGSLQETNRIASTHKELTQAWTAQVHEQSLQQQLLALREKHNVLLSEKDRWMLDTLKQQEQHQTTISALEEQLRSARSDAARAHHKIAELEQSLTEAQRRQFDAEQQVHAYSEKMHQATQDIRDLQRAVASTKEADRQDVERARQDVHAHSRRLQELEEELRSTRLRVADLKDEVETNAALRNSLQQKYSSVSVERDELAEQKTSLERQLSLSVVEQRALADEAAVLREKVLDVTAKLRQAEAAAEHRESASQATAASTAQTAELAVTRDHLLVANKELAAARQERSAALEVADALRTEVRRLSAANAALDDEVKHSRHSNDTLSKELVTLREDLRTLTADFRSVQQDTQRQHEAALESLRASVARVEDERQKSIEKYERHLRETEAERVASHQTRFELKEMIQKHEAAAASLHAQLASAKEELERKRDLSPTRAAADKAAHDNKLAAVSESLAAAQKATHDMQLQRDALRLELDAVHRALSQETHVSRSLNEIVEWCCRELGHLYTKEELPMGIRTMVKERNAAIEEKEAVLSQGRLELAKHEDCIAALRAEVAAALTTAERERQKALDVERELRRVQADAEQARHEIARDSAAHMQRSEAEQFAAISGHLNEIARLREALSGVQSLHAASDDKCKTLQSDMQKLRERAITAEQRADGLERNAVAARQREADILTALQELHLQLEASRAAEMQTRRHVEACRAENAQLRRDTDAAAQLLAQAIEEEKRVQAAERERLQHECDSYKAQVKIERDRRAMEGDISRAAESRCHELEAQLEHVKLERDHSNRELGTMRKSHAAVNDAFEARIKDLENEKRFIEQQVEDLVARLGNADAVKKRLEDELEQCARERADMQREREKVLHRLDASPPRALAPAARSSTWTAPVAHSDTLRKVDAASLHDRRDDVGPAGYSAPPPQQEPLPLPSYSSSSAAGRLARERNDAMLAQFREQRTLNNVAQPSRSAARDQSPAPSLRQVLTAGVTLGALRR